MKKFLSLAAVTALSCSVLAACGANEESSTGVVPNTAGTTAETATESSEEESSSDFSLSEEESMSNADLPEEENKDVSETDDNAEDDAMVTAMVDENGNKYILKDNAVLFLDEDGNMADEYSLTDEEKSIYENAAGTKIEVVFNDDNTVSLVSEEGIEVVLNYYSGKVNF